MLGCNKDVFCIVWSMCVRKLSACVDDENAGNVLVVRVSVAKECWRRALVPDPDPDVDAR